MTATTYTVYKCDNCGAPCTRNENWIDIVVKPPPSKDVGATKLSSSFSLHIPGLVCTHVCRACIHKLLRGYLDAIDKNTTNL